MASSPDRARIVHADCVAAMREMEADSIDAIVTDPPYELGFMGKRWDATGIAYSVELWTEALRVLKPGGHLLAFGGTRTYHRMACAIEDAGFEIRDSLHWVYGSGFPKSLDVSKAIDKDAGAVREVVGTNPNHRKPQDAVIAYRGFVTGDAITAPATDAARQWTGWGTALKPAHEPIVLARKPLGTASIDVVANVERGLRAAGVKGDIRWSRPASGVGCNGHRRSSSSIEAPPNIGCFAGIATGLPGSMATVRITLAPDGTFIWPDDLPRAVPARPLSVAANVLAHGVGGLNVDGCRIPTNENRARFNRARTDGTSYVVQRQDAFIDPGGNGRWPPNLLLSHLPECGDECAPGCAVAEMDAQSGEAPAKPGRTAIKGGNGGALGAFAGSTPDAVGVWPEDLGGGASRFFPCFRYVAKPARAERDEGCRTLRRRTRAEATGREEGSAGSLNPRAGAGSVHGAHNHHPTVKPVELMEWLVKLVTPPGGLVLDPFTGSGTTGVACVTQGFRFIGIEREAEYVELARARIAAAPGHQLSMFEGVG